MTNLPLTDLAAVAGLAATLPCYDQNAADAARARQDQLTKPQGALGRLEELAIFMAGWQGNPRPMIGRAQALVFAGNHGVCAQGVSPFPSEVTAQMVANFEQGGAAINQLCRVNGADLRVVSLDLDRPTADFTTGPAMSDAECLTAMAIGADAVDLDTDVLILGEMGIGNSTISAALALGIFGGKAADWVGRGTGSDEAGMEIKRQVVQTGVALHQDRCAMGKLAALGGREQAAICGAVLAARMARIPVLLDGYICTAAVAPLFGTAPAFLDHCLVGHRSVEQGHDLLLRAMGQQAVLDFDMRLGEGTGAALALGILRSALACHNGMATFAEASVNAG